MKPRLFIGSSVEGLPLAYGAQQNLRRAVEVIVWSQGVFKLSLTSVESLTSALQSCDFGMFVFSPDDMVKIRGVENLAVRDNVVFELGMFIGLLGRERCFIMLPEKHSDVRIPSDLIGLTPATYESDRSDGNHEAATGPGCHLITQAVQRLGYRFERSEQQDGGGQSSEPTSARDAVPPLGIGQESGSEPSEHENSWIDSFLAGDIPKALELLQQAYAAAATDETRVDLETWIGFVKSRQDAPQGVALLKETLIRWPKYLAPYSRLGRVYLVNHHAELALHVAQSGAKQVGAHADLVAIESQALADLGRADEAKAVLLNAIVTMRPDYELYLLLADQYAEGGDLERAIGIVEEADRQFPSNEPVLKKYLSLVQKLPDPKLRLVPLQRLISLRPKESEYYTMRGNAYLELELNDRAMRDYKRANELVEGKEEWIVSNIANLLKNRGFYQEAISMFEQSIKMRPDHQYAHERLAQSMKLRDEEDEKASTVLKEARRELASAAMTRREQYLRDIAPPASSAETVPANDPTKV